MPDILNWPAVAGVCIIILGIVALVLYRPAFVRLIDRTSRASKNGVVFESPQEGRKVKPVPLSFAELMRTPISATVLNREGNIKGQLHSFNLQNDSEKIDVLTRVAAVARVEKEFTDIAHIVFGSQLELLVQLAGTPNGFPILHAEPIFKRAQENYPQFHANRNFSDWLNYMTSNNLITIQNDKMDISQFGSDFLKYLIDARLAYQRYG